MKTHGIMFHHFHDNELHIKEQGSITAEELERLIDYYEKEYCFITAQEYYNKALKGKLENYEVCITFDDALKCQFDIAYPILRKKGITAFWFIYTSPLIGVHEKIEIYRHFRFSVFSDIEDFYSAFFKVLIDKQRELKCNIEKELREFRSETYEPDFTFYTDNDRLFRYLRDKVLRAERYDYIMDIIMEQYGYNKEENSKILWLSKENIKTIYNAGGIIGLHSHTHPMVLTDLSYREQYEEYSQNKEILEDIIQDKVSAISYPCNSYNNDTLKIIKKLNILLGFRANIIMQTNNIMELPREDHTNIIRRMKDENYSIYK